MAIAIWQPCLDRLRRLTQCAKEGRKERWKAERSLLLRKFGMDHRNRPRAEKRQSISGRTEQQNCCSVLLVHCRRTEARSSKSREGAHAIKVRSRYADDCFHSALFRRSMLCGSLRSVFRPLFPLYDWTETKGTNEPTNEPTNGEIHGAKNRLPKLELAVQGAQGVHWSRSKVRNHKRRQHCCHGLSSMIIN